MHIKGSNSLSFDLHWQKAAMGKHRWIFTYILNLLLAGFSSQEEASLTENPVISDLTSVVQAVYDPGYDVAETMYLIDCYYKFVLIVVPISYIFNFLSFVTFVGLSRKQNIALVLMCLSITDSFAMTNYADAAITKLANYKFMSNWFGCRIWLVLFLAARIASNWFCVLIAFERYLSVKVPLKVGIWVTRKRILLAVAFIVILGIVVECWRPTTMYFEDAVCNTYLDQISRVGVLGFGVSKILGYIIPCILVAILNALLILSLRQWSSKRQETLGPNAKGGSGIDHSLTAMFISMSLFSVICIVPSVYVDGKYYTHTVTGGDPFQYIQLFGSYHIVMIAECFTIANYSFNFLMYCLAGSSFRMQLLRILVRALEIVTCRKIEVKGKSKLLWCLSMSTSDGF